MPKYCVIHPIKKNVIEGIVNLPPGKNQAFKELKANCTSEADWIRSWAVPEQEKIYCEWDAKGPESIRKMFEGGGIEIEAIYEMHVLDGEDYQEKVLTEAI